MIEKTNEREKRAIARVLRAGVRAPEPVVLAWVRTVGPEAILSASLSAIRAVAHAF